MHLQKMITLIDLLKQKDILMQMSISANKQIKTLY